MSSNNETYDSENKNLGILTWHCFKKGVQLGSVVGFFIVGPFLAFRRLRSNNFLKPLEFAKYQIYSIAFGVSTAWLMQLSKYISWENKKECLRDRAYRIDKNHNQNRVDEITLGAFTISWILCSIYTRKPLYSIGFTTPAIVGGLLYHILSSKSNDEKQTEKK